MDDPSCVIAGHGVDRNLYLVLFVSAQRAMSLADRTEFVEGLVDLIVHLSTLQVAFHPLSIPVPARFGCGKVSGAQDHTNVLRCTAVRNRHQLVRRTKNVFICYQGLVYRRVCSFQLGKLLCSRSVGSAIATAARAPTRSGTSFMVVDEVKRSEDALSVREDTRWVVLGIR
jgi:hypothetical protein